MSKVGFICTTHQSVKHRANGFALFNQYVESLYTNCKHAFNLYSFDNASEDECEVDNMPDNFKIQDLRRQVASYINYKYADTVIPKLLNERGYLYNEVDRIWTRGY